jgi:hypothetical protein
MRLAVMQPYFLPYIGYWNLISSADVFVVYDNIQHTKRGWMSRNRMLVNGEPSTFSLELKGNHDGLWVCRRELAPNFDRAKLLRRFEGAYRKAPHFAEVMPLLERIVHYDVDNLFWYIYNSIVLLCGHLGIETKIIVSSEVKIDHSLKAQDKVLALCEALCATEYVNAPGGTALYDRKAFDACGIKLQFLRPLPFEYPQVGGGEFVPWLSIIDVLMHVPLEKVRGIVRERYETFEKEDA